MRYLVTGGLGFVGSWVTRHLALAGHEVFVLSRGSQTPDLGVPYTLVQADITADKEPLRLLLPPGLDGCVHAASFNEGNAPDYGRRALAANGLGTRNILEALADAAEAAGKAPCPFVYLSTFHVYGQDTGEVTEETPPAPRNEYALTHLIGEEYCRFFHRTRGVPAMTVRLSNGYGAPLTVPFGKWYLLLPDLCRMAYRDQRIHLRSPGGVRRDFLWLGDVATVLEFLLGALPSKPELAGQTVNVASGHAPTIAEVAALVAAVYGKRYGKNVSVTLADPNGGAGGRLGMNTAKLAGLVPGFTAHDRMAEEIDRVFAFLEAHKDDA